MLLDLDTFDLLKDCVQRVDRGFAHLPSVDAPETDDNLRAVLNDVAARLEDNYPYPHPLYAGQMLKPPHPVARLAYAMSLWLNPNNHALDGGRASSCMEKEAVAEIAAMFGWDTHLGHLTGGGTMANLEALWVASRLHPGKLVVASEQAHYTHARISEVLGLEFESVAVDSRARMDTRALEKIAASGRLGTVVATLGTTGVGALDPLEQILALQAQYGFRVHADAAYGGYFRLVEDLAADGRGALAELAHADSIVVDPHKHGLQPYGCGCVLFRDPAVGAVYRHDSPYTYFSSEELHLGEISLECSRPGAAAVALWATQRLLPLTPAGRFATDLGKCRRAALGLHARLERHDGYLTLFEPELDIVVWAPAGETTSDISSRSRYLFEEAARAQLHLALIELPVALVGDRWPGVSRDTRTVTCLRSCLMKPEHLDWLETIWGIIRDLARDGRPGRA